MRIFVAVVPPSAIQERLSESFEAKNSTVRKSRVHQLHLTLLFYTDLEEKQLSALTAAVDAICAHTKSFEIRFGQMAFFPNSHKPRVCILELTEGLSDLSAFRNMLALTSPAGFDTKPFSPHLTLARLGESGRAQDCLFCTDERFSFTAKSCIVYESCPSKGGFVHQTRYQSYFKDF